jgi:predicted flap endonuclease-1-like 5' DNA nuclease
MERTLNRLGITSFEQIARFTRQDIERVAEALQSFPDRIVRDDWIRGAKKEYRKKYGQKI